MRNTRFAPVVATVLFGGVAWLGPGAGATTRPLPAAITNVPLPAAASTVPLLAVMASTGDSITRAFDVGPCCVFVDSPQYSWSTGSATKVLSHYRRILRQHPAIRGHATNVAQTGAKMSDLGSQLQRAAAVRPDYVTVLMGANDVCTSTRRAMTPVATFQREFGTALAQFTAARPTARVLVASIPNLYRLWSVLHTKPAARATWQRYGICQSLLSAHDTEADRQAVLAHERSLNTALATVCARYRQCRWDKLATFNVSFAPADVSTVDYFHPSLSGQNRLAGATWAAGYWPGS